MTITATEEAIRATLPTLETGRLCLRPWTLADASVMQHLAGNKCVARYTTLPHPYGDGEAEKFISTHEAQFDAGKAAVLAVTLRETGEITGGPRPFSPRDRSAFLSALDVAMTRLKRAGFAGAG